MITERQAHIHVSGHPGRPELAAMYGWIKPELLLPVHGEMRHLMEQARYGLSLGLLRALVQTEGDILRPPHGEPGKVGHADVGRLGKSGKGSGRERGGCVELSWVVAGYEKKNINIHD